MGIAASAPARRQRGLPALAASASGFLLVALTGCGAGFDAQTNQFYQPAEGVTVRTSQVYAVNTLVVTDGEGNGTVVTSLVNQAPEADKLVSLMATDTSGGDIEVSPLPEGGLELPSQQAVQTATEGQLRVNADAIKAGGLVTLRFEFESAARVEVEVPVIAETQAYADVPIGPVEGATSRPGSSSSP